MQQWWDTTVDEMHRIISTMQFGDVAEILIITFLVYHVLKWIQATRAWQLLKGLIVIVAFLFIAYFSKMHTILWVAENVAPYALTALVVVLQPEIRRALEELGKRNMLTNVIPFDSSRKEAAVFDDRTINEITRACVEMGKAKTGALIVVENKDALSDYERTGIEVDGIVTSQLLINVFEHNTPLHDGAAIIRGNRLTSATCYLPLTDNQELGKELGTRHRAGVGISEVTDSCTVIVSEETGNISVAVGGVLKKMANAEELRKQLELLKAAGDEEEKGKHRWKAKNKEKK